MQELRRQGRPEDSTNVAPQGPWEEFLEQAQARQPSGRRPQRPARQKQREQELLKRTQRRQLRRQMQLKPNCCNEEARRGHERGEASQETNDSRNPKALRRLA